MRYYKLIIDGYLVAAGTGNGGTEITEAEYAELLEVIGNKPTADSGYDYRLTEALTWERYELPVVDEETTAYTAEQLAEMTTAELKSICAELGISATMTKQNMIELILGKQTN